ncbi:MAG: aspartate/glutamate racemase family protein, partial [Sulfitobacter sp.]|nr:aspartate/glutamate racemase family protein [Sulfitobacter sp.]
MTATELPRLGILMLDTRFPRIPGDVGNPATWDFPVRYRVVERATPEAIVRADPEPFVEAFIEAGRALVSQGCTGIATTCGFLALVRPRLSAALGVPVAASALEQGPQIAAALPPGQRIGVLTISKESLTPAHLNTAGLGEDTPVEGMEGTSFARTILGNETELEVRDARREMVIAARRLISAHADIGSVILECT